MGRRSRSPVRGSKHYDDPRDRRSPGPSGLLVRNLPLNARNEDLRIPFERYGPLKDIYMPKDYYTGEPRGFGFVKYRYSEDATTAMKHLNHTDIGGREIRIVYAEENRKTPKDMRRITGTSSRSSRRRRSPSRSPRRRNHSYSRSPSPRREPRNHGRRDAHVSSRRHHSVSRSASPKDDRRHRSIERSPRRSRYISKSPSRSKKVERSPRKSRSISKSPPRSKKVGRSPRRSRSVSKSPPRSKKVERSPRRSRSISKSPPRSKKVERSPRRSRSISKSPPRSKKVERSPRRSRSISMSPPRSKKGDETSHHHSSPGENGHGPHDEDYMPDKSPIPQKNSYSRSRSRSITKSPR